MYYGVISVVEKLVYTKKVVGSIPSPHKMFLEAIFSCLVALGIFCILLFSFLFCIRNFWSNVNEFFVLCFYSFFCFCIVCSFYLWFAWLLVSYSWTNFEEPLYVMDPTRFSYTYFSLILFFSLLSTTPYCFFLSIFYSSNLHYKNTFALYSVLSGFFFYLLIIIFWITKVDLHLSNWISMWDVPNFSLIFEFQPNFETFLASFLSEYWDVSCFFVLFVFVPFLASFLNIIFYEQLSFARYSFVFLVYSVYVLYLFFEYQVLTNCIIVFLLWFFFILFRVVWLYVSKAKSYKESQE